MVIQREVPGVIIDMIKINSLCIIVGKYLMVGKCLYISSEFDNKNYEYLSVQSPLP